MMKKGHFNTILCGAILNSDIKGIEASIKFGADPNHTDYSKTPLELAFQHDNLEAFKLLLAYGAIPNQTLKAKILNNVTNGSLLYKNSLEYFKVLIESEYEFDYSHDEPLERLLTSAITTHDNTFVEALVKQGANVNHINSAFENQTNMLELAFEVNNMAAFKLLLAYGADHSPKLLSSMYEKLRKSDKSRPQVSEYFKLLIKSGYIFDTAKHYQYVQDGELLDLINQQNPTYWQKLKNVSSAIKSTFLSLFVQSGPDASTQQDSVNVKSLKRKRAQVAAVQPQMAVNSEEIIHSKPTKRAKIQPVYSREEAAIKIQRSWRSYYINKKISDGTINDPMHIQQLQKRFIFLNVDPKLPTQESQIDQEKATNYLNDIANPNLREVARKVIKKHITYLSTSDLIKRIIQSSQYLNNYFSNHPLNTEVNILVEQWHSSEWIAGIAARYLNICPKGILSYSRIQGLDSIEITYNKQNNASMLLMDDVTYSGSQLEYNLYTIARKHIENCKPSGITHIKTFIKSNSTLLSPKQLDIYIMILFMNEYAFKSINSLSDDFKKFGINLIMIKPKVLRNIRNCGLSEEELNRFSLICGESYFSENSLNFERKMLLFSSWKKPDHVSMPCNFSDGFVPDYLKKPGQANVAHKFLPDVKPPYHRR